MPLDPFTGAAIAQGVLGGVSGLAGLFTSARAVKHQLRGEQDYRAILAQILGQEEGRLSPHAGLAEQALGQLQAGQAAGAFSPNADIYSDPSYASRVAEGQRALERRGSAAGVLNSSSFGKALVRFGQDYGSQEYGAAFNRSRAVGNDAFSRLSSLYGQGLNSSNQLGAVRQRVGFGQADSLRREGEIRAQGPLSTAGALSKIFGTGADIAGGYAQRSLSNNQADFNAALVKRLGAY